MATGLAADELSRLYLRHALAGRGTEAVQLVLDALLHASLDLTSLYDDVLTPAAHRVGDLWHDNEITVADEHYVTQLNQRIIAIAGTLRPEPEHPRDGHIVLACPPGEEHDTGLRMLADLLDACGYQTSLLGASTPVEALVAFVERTRPAAVGLSIASPLAISGLAKATRALREHDPELRILVGGRCVALYPAVPDAVDVEAYASARETLAVLASSN